MLTIHVSLFIIKNSLFPLLDLCFSFPITPLVFTLFWGPVLHFLFHGSLDHEPLHPQTPKDNPSGQKPPFWGHLWWVCMRVSLMVKWLSRHKRSGLSDQPLSSYSLMYSYYRIPSIQVAILYNIVKSDFMWYHIKSSTYSPLRGARFIALTALNREDQEHLTNHLAVLRPARFKQGKIRLPWHDKS